MSKLTIYSVTSSDYGSYACEARNDIGTTIEKAELKGKRNLTKIFNNIFESK